MAAPLIRTRDSAFQGALLGLAIGDALAYPCEFRSRATILAASARPA